MPISTIGIAGAIASGKSTVSSLLAEKLGNCNIIDVDSLAKSIYRKDSSAIQGLVDIFGKKAVPDGIVPDFSLIGDIVFSDSSCMDRLNNLMFPKIRSEIQSIIENKKKDTIGIVDAAILFDCGLDKFCDYIILVCSETASRINRLVKKDPGIGKEKARLIIAGQKIHIDHEKVDRIIENDEKIASLSEELDKIADEIKRS